MIDIHTDSQALMLAGFDEPAFREKLKKVFTPAQPIARPEHLHGRDPKLRLIDRALHSPGKHIFVYGDRGVGKTSLARTAAAIHCGDAKGFGFVASTKLLRSSILFKLSTAKFIHFIQLESSNLMALTSTSASQSSRRPRRSAFPL